MTKRILRLALAAGAAAAFAVPSTASADVYCTHRPIGDCVKELLQNLEMERPCIPNGDLEDPCRW